MCRCAPVSVAHDHLDNCLQYEKVSCINQIMRTKVTKRGQVSVPSEVRRKLQIRADTTLEWVVEGATARVIPLPSDALKAFRGSGKKGAVKRLLRERRGDRQKENAG